MISQGTLVKFIPPGYKHYEDGMVVSSNGHISYSDQICITPWRADENPIATKFIIGGQCGVVAPKKGSGHFAPDMTVNVHIQHGRVEDMGQGDPEVLSAILAQFKELISPGQNKSYNHPYNKTNPHYGELFWAADVPYPQCDERSNTVCIALAPPSIYEARGYIPAIRLYSKLESKKPHNILLRSADGRQAFVRQEISTVPCKNVKRDSLSLRGRRLLPANVVSEIADYIFATCDEATFQRRLRVFFGGVSALSPIRDARTDQNVKSTVKVPAGRNEV
jgi:hypothetical protein